MSDLSNAPIMSGGPEPFYKVWIKALTRPNEQTFAELAASPSAKATTGYLWYFIAALVQFFFASLIQNAAMQQMMQQFSGEYSQFSSGGGFFSNLITAVCGAPIAAGVGTLMFALMVAVVQWVAKMFGGRGTNDQMVYAMSAILSPILLVGAILTLFSAIPFVGLCFGIVSLLISLYGLVLEVMAVKGVNQFGWGAALGSLFIPLLTILFVCGCLVIGSLMLMGPVIGDVFSGINQSLQNVP